MASSQAWYEFNGASLATPSAANGCYWRSNDSSNNGTYTSNPITAGSNSYSKIQSLLFSTGSSSANVYGLNYIISANGNPAKQAISSATGTFVTLSSTPGPSFSVSVGTPVSAYNSSLASLVNALPTASTSLSTTFSGSSSGSSVTTISVLNASNFSVGSSIYVSNGSGGNCFPTGTTISSINLGASPNTITVTGSGSVYGAAAGSTVVSLPVITNYNSGTRVLTLSQAPSAGWSNVDTIVADPTGNFWGVFANASSIATAGYSAPATPGITSTLMPTTGTAFTGAWATAGSPNYAFGTANAGSSGSPVTISASGTLYTTALYTQLQTYVGASAGPIGSLTITATWTES